MTDNTNFNSDENTLIDFGFETIPVSEKESRVRAVFDSVASSYDVMNDVMSLGIHRAWKDTHIRMISPTPAMHLIDLAGDRQSSFRH